MNQVEAAAASQSLFSAFLMILVSEIGDKTFFIACILSMRHPRIVVFAGAFGALLVMTILSALLGHVVPTFISKQYTQLLASGLFVVFGLKLMTEASSIPDSQAMEELEQVSLELGEDSKEDTKPQYVDVESGAPRSTWSILNDNIFIQSFILTFVAEWGDRSQIATVALAGAEDFWFVTIGGLLGHGLCTAAAVMGGRFLASRISVKTVTFAGALLFLVFGALGFYQAFSEYQ